MKKTILLLCIIAANLTSMAQSFKNIEMNVKCVFLPTRPLAASIKTFSIDLDAGSVDLARVGINSSSIYSFVRLNGYSYTQKNADICIKVSFSKLTIPYFKAVKDENLLCYYAQYSPITAPIEIKIIDKAGNVIASETINDEVSLRYPQKQGDLRPDAGYPSENELIDITSNNDTKDKVSKMAINTIMSRVNAKINLLFAFTPIVNKQVVMDFKTKKNEDFYVWNEQAKSLILALNHVTEGASPEEFEKETKSANDFWKSEIVKYKADAKNYKTLIGAASHNLQIIATYANHFEESNALFQEFKSLKWKFNEDDTYLNTFSTVWSTYLGVSKATADYKTLAKILPLALNHSEAKLTLADGKTIEGVIIQPDRFYVQPYQNNYGVLFISNADYLAALGMVNKSNTREYKITEIKEFTIADKTFKSIEYKNGTELSFGKNVCLAEEFIKGDASIYLLFKTPTNAPVTLGSFTGGVIAATVGGKQIPISEHDSRTMPLCLISIDKGIPSTLLNTKDLSEAFKKNPEISEKIKKGGYGTKALSEKTGLMAKIANALTENISLSIYSNIVNDYNAGKK